MVEIPQVGCPTLEAIDAAMEARQQSWRNKTLSMKELWHPCKRRLWYLFRWAGPLETFTADKLRLFESGHRGEEVMAERLRMVPGLQLWTTEQRAGKERQIKVEGVGGHLGGRIDGVVLGLIQAPKTPHVWEHKEVNEKEFRKLQKAKTEQGEKGALQAWNEEYWCQAQSYMHHMDLERHYLTAATPGGRDYVAVRTERDQAAGLRLVAKAEQVIGSERPPERHSDDPTFHLCKWCQFHELCHGGGAAERNCRTCLASTGLAEGGWHCARHEMPLDLDMQKQGCAAHLYRPELVPGEQVDAAEDGAWVLYRLRDGSEWKDGVTGGEAR